MRRTARPRAPSVRLAEMARHPRRRPRAGSATGGAPHRSGGDPDQRSPESGRASPRDPMIARPHLSARASREKARRLTARPPRPPRPHPDRHRGRGPVTVTHASVNGLTSATWGRSDLGRPSHPPVHAPRAGTPRDPSGRTHGLGIPGGRRVDPPRCARRLRDGQRVYRVPLARVLIGLAIALHNLPKEFAMAVPAVTLRSRRFLFGAALLSTLAEPMGAIIGLVAVGIAPPFTMTPRWQLRQLPRLQQCGVRSCGRPTATGR
jgi:hypothetical protein